MEKRKKKLKLFDSFRNDLVLRVFSIVLAVVIWIILSITLFPTIYITVYDVPVKLEIEGTEVESNGLSALNFDEDTTVDVRLSGMRYEIGNYSSSDLIATLNIDDVTKAGVYDLSVNVRSANGDNCEILNVSPSKVRVSFDTIQSVELPIEVEYTGISAEDG